METPEARSGYVCPECGKMFKTETGYKNHYQSMHEASDEQKQLFGRYFVIRSSYLDDKIVEIVHPKEVNKKGILCGYAIDDNCSIGTLIHCTCEEEISIENAKIIIKEWYNNRIARNEELHRDKLKKMFDEKEE